MLLLWTTLSAILASIGSSRFFLGPVDGRAIFASVTRHDTAFLWGQGPHDPSQEEVLDLLKQAFFDLLQ